MHFFPAWKFAKVTSFFFSDLYICSSLSKTLHAIKLTKILFNLERKDSTVRLLSLNPHYLHFQVFTSYRGQADKLLNWNILNSESSMFLFFINTTWNYIAIQVWNTKLKNSVLIDLCILWWYLIGCWCMVRNRGKYCLGSNEGGLSSPVLWIWQPSCLDTSTTATTMRPPANMNGKSWSGSEKIKLISILSSQQFSCVNIICDGLYQHSFCSRRHLQCQLTP